MNQIKSNQKSFLNQFLFNKRNKRNKRKRDKRIKTQKQLNTTQTLTTQLLQNKNVFIIFKTMVQSCNQ